MLVAFVCALLPASFGTQATEVRPSVSEAREAVTRAEDAVAQALAVGALWTTAQDALRDAQAALAAGDEAAAVEAARFAAAQAKLGIEQLAYPRFPQ